MIQLPENFDSIFRYIVVVSQRAEQLMRGAKPRTECRYTKHTLRARNDVDEGQVEWRILTQEELDARRQEIVDQFKAEVAGDETAPEEAVRDVLPTTVPASKPAEDEATKDDELMRLQRLLGMAGLGAAPEPDGAADTAEASSEKGKDDSNLEGDFEAGDPAEDAEGEKVDA